MPDRPSIIALSLALSEIHGTLSERISILKGPVKLKFTPVDLPQLMTQTWLAFEATATSKGLSYTSHGLSTLPQWVLADALQLTKVLASLLNNAVSYTLHGRVELHAHFKTENASRGSLYVYVVDTGTGVPQRIKDKIFNPDFHTQAPSSDQQTSPVTGNRLGLAVTSSIVQAWKGHIEVRSTLGAGSTFMVELPLTLHHPAGLLSPDAS